MSSNNKQTHPLPGNKTNLLYMVLLLPRRHLLLIPDSQGISSGPSVSSESQLSVHSAGVRRRAHFHKAALSLGAFLGCLCLRASTAVRGTGCCMGVRAGRDRCISAFQSSWHLGYRPGTPGPELLLVKT